MNDATKEARRVETAGSLRGYSRVALGASAIARDPRRGKLRKNSLLVHQRCFGPSAATS